MRQLLAVLTCHNRRAQTLACLDGLFASKVEGMRLSAVVVDDGSCDGTSDEVGRRFGAQVRVIRGDGQLFWNGGMRVAMARAMQSNPDFILWLNDDTIIKPCALTVMVRTHDARVRSGDSTAIVVAACASPVSGQLTYGGLRLNGSRWRRLALGPVEPSAEPLRCDTMNGNCVLLPRAVWQELRNLDEGFVHGLGDFDYGLRATAIGIPIWLAPGLLGHCARNSDSGSFKDAELSLTARWRAITGIRGVPMRAWALYVRRHGGALWPLYWVWPYIKVLVAGVGKIGLTR